MATISGSSSTIYIFNAFYGTGLGARSYSVIEQGMISRFIEAKPEELRNYLEEVAGISFEFMKIVRIKKS